MSRAFILINCKHGYQAQTIEQLKKIDVVKEVNPHYGSFDMMVKLEAKTNEEINDAISSKIGKIKNIKNSMTLSALD